MDNIHKSNRPTPPVAYRGEMVRATRPRQHLRRGRPSPKGRDKKVTLKKLTLNEPKKVKFRVNH